MQELTKIIQEVVSNSGLEPDQSKDLVQKITKELQESITLSSLKAKLSG